MIFFPSFVIELPALALRSISPTTGLIFLKAIHHTFLWFIGAINHPGSWKNTRRA